jgi:hypothetical protein
VYLFKIESKVSSVLAISVYCALTASNLEKGIVTGDQYRRRQLFDRRYRWQHARCDG